MKHEGNTGFRILARDIAQELTTEEIENVNGGECEGSAKVSLKQSSGKDAEVKVECHFT